MQTRSGWLVALLAAVLTVFAAGADDKRRNPFDVDDVDDPDGQDVKDFAATAQLAGDKDDKNAEQWVETETEGKAGELDGEWSGRWENGQGRARVKATKDRVFILYTDVACGIDGSTWLLEAVKVGKNELRGRWVNTVNNDDTGVFYGVIVGDDRIDGTWGQDARWDFRRKLQKK